ncbi:baseplate J/gp47 family protein [Leptotrichia trevisanii]|uniref:baseplate J/gp47 family protein n=1 Tax=Leptotrichia trevisanii TaxID=109328 RepID=UPI0026EF9EA5|nr:baseplate J/gp47 family protein [Leptotrichia trevisanii]
MARIEIPNLNEIIETMSSGIKENNADFSGDKRTIWYMMIGYPIGRLAQQKLYKIQYLADKANIYKAENEELDDILNGNFNFPRKQPSFSKVFVTLNAVNGTTVDIGELGVKTVSGIEFFNINTATATNNTITLEFECEVAGSVGNITSNEITKFITTVSGILSINSNTAGEGGQDRENDIKYRDRWFNSRFRSYWNIDGIKSALMDLDGVESVYVNENHEPIAINGIEQKSVIIVVDGGINSQIAQTIFEKKDQAIKSVGDIKGIAKDTSGVEREIYFYRPKIIKIDAKYTSVPANYAIDNKAKMDNLINNYIKSKGVNGFISAYECFIESIRPNISEIDLKHLDLSFKLASDTEYSTNLQLKIKEKGELNV